MKGDPLVAFSIQPAWLDVALDTARRRSSNAKTELEMRMRDQLPAPVSRDKTVRILARTWLEPPRVARRMIDWAVAISASIDDSRILHIGALIATHPFFGAMTSIAGRELRQTGAVTVPGIRKGMGELWGERTSLDVSARAFARTLVAFRILRGDPHHRLDPAPLIVTPAILRPWLSHALILTRGSDAVDLNAIDSAPEFFMLSVEPAGPRQ